MTPDQLIQVAAGVAFPAAIAVYLLVRLDARLEELRTAIEQLRDEVQRLARGA